MPAEFELALDLQSPPDTVWEWVERPALFLAVAAPLVHCSPVGMSRFPDKWGEQEYRASMKLLGMVPIGWQAICVDFPETQANTRVLRDRGYGPLLKVWEHRIEVSPRDGGTHYVDRIRLDAGWMTPLAAFLVRQFFRHRQRRLAIIDSGGFRSLESV